MVMEAGVRVIEIARRWQLTRYFSSYVVKMKLDLWGCFVGRADLFMRDVERVQQCVLMNSQEQLTVAWVASYF